MRFSASRSTLICLAVGLTLIAMSLVTPLFSGARVHAQGFANPAGQWNLVVTFKQTGQQEPSLIEFDTNNGYSGQVVNHTPFYGTGWWVTMGSNKFFYIFYEFITQNNVPIGYVLVIQYGTLGPDGTTYTAHGTGRFYPFNGPPAPADVTTTQATRMGD